MIENSYKFNNQILWIQKEWFIKLNYFKYFARGQYLKEMVIQFFDWSCLVFELGKIFYQCINFWRTRTFYILIKYESSFQTAYLLNSTSMKLICFCLGLQKKMTTDSKSELSDLSVSHSQVPSFPILFVQVYPLCENTVPPCFLIFFSF